MDPAVNGGDQPAGRPQGGQQAPPVLPGRLPVQGQHRLQVGRPARPHHRPAGRPGQGRAAERHVGGLGDEPEPLVDRPPQGGGMQQHGGHPPPLEELHDRLGERPTQPGPPMRRHHRHPPNPPGASDPGPARGPAEDRPGGDPDQLTAGLGHHNLPVQPGPGEPDHPGQPGPETGLLVQRPEPRQVPRPGRADRGSAGPGHRGDRRPALTAHSARQGAVDNRPTQLRQSATLPHRGTRRGTGWEPRGSGSGVRPGAGSVPPETRDRRRRRSGGGGPGRCGGPRTARGG